MNVDIYVDKAKISEDLFSDVMFNGFKKMNDDKPLDFFDNTDKNNPFFIDNKYITFSKETPEDIIELINKFIIQMTLVYGIHWFYIFKKENDIISKQDFKYIGDNFVIIYKKYGDYLIECMKNNNIPIPKIIPHQNKKIEFIDMFCDINDDVSELFINLKEQVFFYNKDKYKSFRDIQKPSYVFVTYKLNYGLDNK